MAMAITVVGCHNPTRSSTALSPHAAGWSDLPLDRGWEVGPRCGETELADAFSLGWRKRDLERIRKIWDDVGISYYIQYVYHLSNIFESTGWWFGTCLIFFNIPIDFHIFFRGVAQPPTRSNISTIYPISWYILIYVYNVGITMS